MMPFESFRHIHLVGIKGVAMTSLAWCLRDIAKVTGVIISGSDCNEDFVTKEEISRGKFLVHQSFDPGHIAQDVDLVIYTGAHGGSDNVEVQEARRRGVQTISHAEALGVLMRGQHGISVCGTGGKSTTSAMVAWILSAAGLAPSYSVGVGSISNLDATGRYVHDGSGKRWFVAEADEYAVDPLHDKRPRFIFQNPELVICPNLSFDHPDIYPDFIAMQETFLAFFSTSHPQLVLLNGDVSALRILGAKCPALTVGFEQHCDVSISEPTYIQGSLICTFAYQGSDPRMAALLPEVVELKLSYPGKHTARNAVLALIAARVAGVPIETATQALSDFRGTKRRFERKLLHGDTILIDDYAHTPDEITATIEATRAMYPKKRVVVAFQPHTYSRTKALFDGFVTSLSTADEVYVLEIFASAREAYDPTITSQHLIEAIRARKPSIAVHAPSSLASLRESLRTYLGSDCVILTTGAGNIYEVYEGF